MQNSGNGSNGGVEGYLEGLENGRIVGWAWLPQQPDSAALVELVDGEHVIAVTSATGYRGDLADAGKRNGFCSFEFLGVERFPRGVELRARVTTEAEAYALPGAPVVLKPDGRAPTPPSHDPAPPVQTDTRGASFPLRGPQGLIGYVDQFGPDAIKGWAYRRGVAGSTLLTLWDGDQQVAEIEAKMWRPDLSELRQGDGRCGINVAMPAALRDGRSHVVDLRLAGSDQSIMPERLNVRFDPPAPSPHVDAPPRRSPGSGAPLFSIIVNFYNMRREAERTLTALSRAYQRNIDDIEYEVLCIDNGSKVPLERAWIESFGPEFELFQPTKLLPSPCAAINEAARKAKGRYLAIMIDGAHVLTPGAFREAADAFRETPDCVFALRQWWMGGDQRWLSAVGYTREMEDILFARINWPADGYELFRVGSPIVESPNSWFDGMGESNCLFVPAALYADIGGMDEGFDEPGAGFANLDLFRRAVDASGDRVIAPLGEASFHQYHGGTTTNVDDDEKDRRVRVYENQYRDIRGETFGAVDHHRIFVRGRLRTDAMPTPRQRPWFAVALGVTDRVRPGNLPQLMDPGAQKNFQGVYAECALYQDTTWAGRPVGLAPADLINIQAALASVRPSVIVTTSRDEGFVYFLHSILPVIALDGARIIRVLSAAPAAPPLPGVQVIVGAACDKTTLAKVEAAIGPAEDVMVLFQAPEGDFLPIDALHAYARFVSFRSYLIFLQTVMGQPWLGYSRNWFAAAIREFMAQNRTFAVDPTPDRQIASLCAGGFLQRVYPSQAEYDPSLDYFESPETV